MFLLDGDWLLGAQFNWISEIFYESIVIKLGFLCYQYFLFVASTSYTYIVGWEEAISRCTAHG